MSTTNKAGLVLSARGLERSFGAVVAAADVNIDIRTVAADQAQAFAGADVDVDIGGGHHRTEGFLQPLRRQHRAGVVG